MRQLGPGVAEERKRKLLQWVIHRYIKTSIPVASQSIAEDSGMRLSSASIRNLLKELEDEGYLVQPHTSAGRVPSDKGYRFYVDYLIDVQRLAAGEKETIEKQYSRRVDELDHLLSETSKLLSHVSHSAGLVLSPKIEKHSLKRLELIPMGAGQVLAVVVTQAGLIRHWPIKLSAAPTASQINRLNRFLNDHIQAKSIREVQKAVRERIEQAEREFKELGELANSLLSEIALVQPDNELYLDGATQMLSHPEDLGDLQSIQSLISVLEGKQALAELLQQEIDEERPARRPGAAASKGMVQVRIGKENKLPQLKNVSLVTTTYRIDDEIVGVLGIMGSKRMDYTRMMSLVDHVSDLVSKTMESWTKE
ncbi:MAG: heat-inducible transcription repressor HrcA [Elusimicrobia bacterium]|nr:heat-inducible transcription repressor HrcA [Elusimicrobiota bacterium]